jgi:hypothetical protein
MALDPRCHWIRVATGNRRHITDIVASAGRQSVHLPRQLVVISLWSSQPVVFTTCGIHNLWSSPARKNVVFSLPEYELPALLAVRVLDFSSEGSSRFSYDQGCFECEWLSRIPAHQVHQRSRCCLSHFVAGLPHGVEGGGAERRIRFDRQIP